MRFFKLYDLFPLYGSRGFIGDVVEHAVDRFYFGCDAAGYAANERYGQFGPFGGHIIGCVDGARRYRGWWG